MKSKPVPKLTPDAPVVPERHQGRKKNVPIPQLNPRSGPSLHSSKGPPTGLSGLPDPLGIHQMFVMVMQDYLDDEEIRKTHREPVEPNSEEERLQQLRDKWLAEYDDMLRPPPPGLPPWRAVNHRIPLIDENKQYRYRLPRCPEAVQEELLAKIKRYTESMWWKMTTATQAAPLLCVAKKNGKLRHLW
ncbi:hypothetical protein K466DRAFT_606578 [Polyporus arcularius HHB13444]|uniref:Uncharacterized protein n=1 Tax=Polyporus arcularius HHB13444 TaxID=1314778 RepID=A0A5C3NQL9_9APHY|nr:hypothetical protein K466DRAFT_606578 [Polyporus arcularius HHB13444]